MFRVSAHHTGLLMVLMLAAACKSPRLTPDPDDNPAGDAGTIAKKLAVTDPTENQSLSALAYEFKGTCVVGSTVDVTADSNAAKAISSSCTDGVLSVKVEFTASSGARALTFSSTGSISVVRHVNFTNPCPTGFIAVPSNPTLGTATFYMAKYEMKNVSGAAQSVAAGSPWNTINRAAAAAACTASGTTLMTNAQWQTAARNLELVAINWSGAAVGSGVIPRGLTDNASDGVDCAAAPCAASIDDTNGYYGTGNTLSQGWGSGAEQRRTLLLSNGQVVWDFSGNVAEWMSDNVTADLSPAPTLSGLGNLEYNNAAGCAGSACFATSVHNRDYFAPFGNYSSTQDVGMLIAGGGAYGGTVVRGSHRSGTTFAGIFATDLTNASSLLSARVGFRCTK